MDIDIGATVTWTVNSTEITTSEHKHIFTNIVGNVLTLSPLTTSDAGNYTCTLTFTASPQTPHVLVTVQNPVESPEEVIIVKGKCTNIFIHRVI